MQITEAGFISYWARTIRKNSSSLRFLKPVRHSEIEDTTFKLDEFAAVFTIWAVGMIIACITFVCEKMYFKFVNEPSAQNKGKRTKIKVRSSEKSIIQYRNVEPRKTNKPIRVYTYLE